MATATSAKEVFENICSRFKADKAVGESALFKFDLSGDNGGQYWAKITNGSCSAGEGEPPAKPDITVISSAENFVKLVNGEMNPMMGMMQGKFKVDGNMSLALKMVSWFDLS